MRISLEKAQELLLRGEVVAIPTETVYGLAAAIDHPKAIDQIFTLKNRPTSNPLIIHIADPKQILSYVPRPPKDIDKLAEAFWPGPLTLVLPVEMARVPNQVRAGLQTAAFRVPGHKLARELLAQTGPLVMPSANRSGRPSSTCAEHVESDFGLQFPVLDGGSCGFGVESTILYWQDNEWQVARLGALPPESFECVLGYLPKVVGIKGESPICPGQLYRHYAPKATLRLCKDVKKSSGIIVGFKEREYCAKKVYTLGSLKRPTGVAENLYAVLRQLDVDGVAEAWVDIDIPQTGLWRTIVERLNKAAQG